MATTPLVILKKKAVLTTKPADLPLRSWIDVARKTITTAEASEKGGNEEGAYIEWRKWAQIMDAVLKHPDYKSSMSAKNADYLAYQDLKQRFVSVMQHIREMESRLEQRDRAAPTTPVNSAAELPSPASPPMASFGVPLSPVPSTSKLSEPPKKRPISGGLASRMAALQDAGMSVQSTRRPSIPEEVAPERPAEAPRIENGHTPPSLSARQPRRPLPATPGVPTAVPLVEVPSSAGRGPSPIPPLDDTSRPASAPTPSVDYLPPPPPPLRPSLSTSVDPAPSEPTAMTAFGNSFPTLDDFDSRFPDVPSSEPGKAVLSNGISTSFSAPSPIDFGASSALKRSPAHPALETLRSPPQETVSRFSEDSPRSKPIPSLPRTNFVLPDNLWAYLQPPSTDQPTVLLLDVRDRADFERYRIRAPQNVCIEPITLRQEVASQRLEASLVLSPESERQAFVSRDQFDLVVIYDRSSTTIPSHSPPVSLHGADDPARSLYNLHAAIFEREYHRSLRRPPVILVGGIEAWIKTIGSKGLEGSEASTVASPRSRSGTNGSIAEASAKLESTGARRGSLSGSNEVKKSHRKASIPPPEGFYGQPSLSRSVVDVMTQNTYNSSNSSAYFSRQPNALSSTSYIGSPIASPPLAATSSMSRQMSGSGSIDFASPSYSSPAPRQRAPVDYPSLGIAPQRPPLAAQPNGAPTRPPPAMPHVQRMSSSTFAKEQVSPTAAYSPMSSAAQLSQMVNWGDGTVGMTGLKNLGNTCYMNSTLQCMSATIPLARFFKDGSYKKAINKLNPLGTRGALAEAVAQLFGVLWSEQYNFVSPVTFRDAICRFAPQFQGTDQHDSQEFLAFLLDGLHEDLNFVQQKPAPIPYTPEREAELEMLPQQIGGEREWNIYLRRENSVIVAWFQGQYRSKLQCLTCSKTSTTYNNFMYLTLALPSHRHSLGHSKVTLDSLLSAYVQEETLDKDDAWNCPRCKVPRRASKKLSLSRLPPVLIIHLKRFQFRGPFSDKIDTPVHFPLYGLDMGQFVAPPLPAAQAAQYAKLAPDAIPKPPASQLYDLYAVSEQMGTLSSGHSHVRTRDRWCEIGDSKVRPCDENDVRRSVKTAYILFYRRRSS